MSDIINIYFSCDKNYFEKCIISILSILDTHKTDEELSINIIHSDLSEKEFSIAKTIKSNCKFTINFIPINTDNFTKYTENQDMKYLSINAFYRFLIPSVSKADEKKAIYLDCDLLAVSDISELFHQDINGYKAGVIEDKIAAYRIKDLNLKSDKYFNSGVLLLNLDELKKSDLMNETYNYFIKNKGKLEFHDQDILNGIWDNQVKFLDEKFNAQSHCFLRMKKRYKKAGVIRINNPVIIHYTGSLKPWMPYCKHRKATLWTKYQQISPYKLSLFKLFHFKIKRFLSNILYIISNEEKYVIFLFGIKLHIKGKRIYKNALYNN